MLLGINACKVGFGVRLITAEPLVGVGGGGLRVGNVIPETTEPSDEPMLVERDASEVVSDAVDPVEFGMDGVDFLG
jgi:hypothetical protein